MSEVLITTIIISLIFTIILVYKREISTRGDLIRATLLSFLPPINLIITVTILIAIIEKYYGTKIKSWLNKPLNK